MTDEPEQAPPAARVVDLRVRPPRPRVQRLGGLQLHDVQRSARLQARVLGRVR